MVERLKDQQKFELAAKKFLDSLEHGSLSFDEARIKKNQEVLSHLTERLHGSDLVQDEVVKNLRARAERALRGYRVRVEHGRLQQEKDFQGALQAIRGFSVFRSQRQLMALKALLDPDQASETRELPEEASALERLAFGRARGSAILSVEQVDTLKEAARTSLAEFRRLSAEVKEVGDDLKPLKDKLRGMRR